MWWAGKSSWELWLLLVPGHWEAAEAYHRPLDAKQEPPSCLGPVSVCLLQIAVLPKHWGCGICVAQGKQSLFAARAMGFWVTEGSLASTAGGQEGPPVLFAEHLLCCCGCVSEARAQMLHGSLGLLWGGYSSYGGGEKQSAVWRSCPPSAHLKITFRNVQLNKSPAFVSSGQSEPAPAEGRIMQRSLAVESCPCLM